jgi:hypothetical protein
MATHDQRIQPHDLPPPVALLQMVVTGYWVSQAIYAAAKLGIADLLKLRTFRKSLATYGRGAD